MFVSEGGRPVTKCRISGSDSFVAGLVKFQDIRLVKPRVEFFTKHFEKGARIHLFFCLALLFVFVIITFSSRYAISLIPRAIFSYFLLLACAYTGRWICRRWLRKDNWIALIVLYILAAVFFSLIGAACYMYFLDLKPEGNSLLALFVTIPGFVIIFLAGGGFVAISRTARREQIHRLLISQQQKESELSLLLSQLSPHFLFNTMNNLYGLAITQHEKVPGLLLKLSDLLRYSVYETTQEFVSLNDELDYIRNYIELERIRIDEELNLTVQLEHVSHAIRIAPMLLIIFVENAFKHAKNTIGHKIVIDIKLSVSNGNILFFAGNSCQDQLEENSLIRERPGLGINNAIKRLELVYGRGGYSLEQRKECHYYTVELTIKAR
jgi:Histidine kinase